MADGSRNQFDPEKHLVIDLSECGISPQEALGMEKLLITAEVGPQDEHGWRWVKAISVRPAAKMK
jgi:hypothetical protein